MVEPLQALVWRLPSGAGGQTAAFYAHKLGQEVNKWADARNIDRKILKWVNVSWYRGIKAPHKILTVPKEYATLFLLSWTSKPPTYVDEYTHPDEQ